MATPHSPTLTVTTPSDREIVMTRVFDAPRELVFEAHTSCEHLKHWWGPRRYELTVCDLDFRPGGAWRFVQRGAGGEEFAFRGEFREIVPPERIVWTFEFEGMPGHISVETLTLEDIGGKTRLTARAVYDSVEDRDAMLQSGMEEGAAETWDRLAEHLQAMTATAPSATPNGGLVIERVFDAPRELVWKAWTEPELMKRWWGPKDYSCPSCEIDFRVGGVWLSCMRSSEGQEIWSTGVYREIVPLERIVCTDSFADPSGNVVPATHYGMPADIPLEMLVTVTLEDLGGRTRMTVRHEGLPAGEMTDGANAGWNESFDKLAESLSQA